MFLLQCLQSMAFAAIVLFPEGDKALQGDLKTANDAYVAGKFPEARKLFLDLAEKKDADAAYALGRIYQTGEGAPDDKADPARAEEFYRKAAETGHEKARLNLAGLLMSDPKKVLEGMKILKDTATAGSGKAMLVLGQLYAGGQIVEQNLTTARDFFEKAAAAGEADGNVLVGQMFEAGQGADQDITKATELYEKAAAGKSIQGMMRLAGLYANGAKGLEKNLDKAMNGSPRPRNRKRTELPPSISGSSSRTSTRNPPMPTSGSRRLPIRAIPPAWNASPPSRPPAQPGRKKTPRNPSPGMKRPPRLATSMPCSPWPPSPPLPWGRGHSGARP